MLLTLHPDDEVLGLNISRFMVGQVFVVRQDLKMGSGKIASQCARKIIFQIRHSGTCTVSPVGSNPWVLVLCGVHLLFVDRSRITRPVWV